MRIDLGLDNLLADGRDEKGRFTENSQAAVAAGRKGGKAAHSKGTVHKLTQAERKRGGSNQDE